MLKGDSIILTEQNDALGHLDKVKFIKQFIENLNSDGFWDEETSDRLIALYGNRGSGKSSIMKTLSYEFNEIGETNSHCLDHTKFKMVFFEARKYEQDHNLAISLLHNICDQTGINLEEKISTSENIWIAVKSLLSGASIDLGLVSYDAEKAIKGVEERQKQQKENIKNYIHYQSEYLKEKNLQQGFNEIFNSIKGKIIVFIDDLDRCEPEHVTNLLASIKLFFTLSDKLIFVVGIDKDAVTKALKIKYHDTIKAEEYLEKIFMIDFSTTPTEYKIRPWLDKEKYDIKDLEALEDMFKAIGFDNPRHIKKLLNKMNLLYSQIVNDSLIDYNPGETGKLTIFVSLVILHEFYGHIRNEDINTNVDSKNQTYSGITYTNIDGELASTQLPRDPISLFLPRNKITRELKRRAGVERLLKYTSTNFDHKEILKNIIDYLMSNEKTKQIVVLNDNYNDTYENNEDRQYITNLILFINKAF